MVSNIKKVKLKYLLKISSPSKNIEALKESIDNNTYDSNKYGLINVVNLYKDYYLILDGHHRVKLLTELYGKDYEVNVEIKNLFKTIVLVLILPFFYLSFLTFKFISIFIKYHSGKLIK